MKLRILAILAALAVFSLCAGCIEIDNDVTETVYTGEHGETIVIKGDGSKEVHYKDGTTVYLNPDGSTNSVETVEDTNIVAVLMETWRVP